MATLTRDAVAYLCVKNVINYLESTTKNLTNSEWFFTRMDMDRFKVDLSAFKEYLEKRIKEQMAENGVEWKGDN